MASSMASGNVEAQEASTAGERILGEFASTEGSVLDESNLPMERRNWADDADEFFDGYDPENPESAFDASEQTDVSVVGYSQQDIEAQRIESGKHASSSGQSTEANKKGSGKRTLDSILETVEEVKRQPGRPNDALKKIFAWTSSKAYKARRVSGKGLASLVLNECTFQFVEEEAGLTIDRHGKLQPEGKAIKVSELIEESDAEVVPIKAASEQSLMILKDLTDEEFLEVLGASFGISGTQSMRMPPEKRLKTDRLLDLLVHEVATALPESEQKFVDFMRIRQEAVLVKATLAEVISAGIKECINALENRLLLFSGSLGEVRTKRPINCIVLSFKCDGHIARRTKAKDKVVKRLTIDSKDYLCRFNIGVRSLYGGQIRSLLEVIVEMEVNLTQTKILSFYCSCRNSIGSIDASLEEIMMIQDEAFDLIMTEDLLDAMDNEEDYELANFSELMGIMVLAGVRPYFAAEGVFSAMWNKCLYAVIKNLSEFKSCFSSYGCKKHFVDSLSLFYLIEPLIDSIGEKKTLLINIMLWCIFLDEATLVSSYKKKEKWRSEMQIAGMILWLVACLYDYDEVCRIDYKYLPVILIHNYCITGKWAISVFNMSQWLASVVTLSSDKNENDNYMLTLLSRMGLDASDEERTQLEVGATLTEKIGVLVKVLNRNCESLGLNAKMKRKGRKETISIMYHVMSLIFKGHPYYAYTEEDLANSNVNSMISERFRSKVDCGEIDVEDYKTVIIDLLQEAETGFDLALDGIPGTDDAKELLMILECSKISKQSGCDESPSDEVIGAITSEGLELSIAQVGIIRNRAIQLSAGMSSEGEKPDKAIATEGLMARVLGSPGTVVTREMFQIRGKQVKTKVGFAKEGKVETAGLSVSIGDDSIFAGSSTIIEGQNEREFSELFAKHKLHILGGIRIESNCLFSIDTAKIRQVLKNIASTKSAISQDVRQCLANSQEKKKKNLNLITNVSIEEFVPFIFSDESCAESDGVLMIESAVSGNYFVNKLKLLIVDISNIVESDLDLFNKSSALREMNVPLLIVIVPLDLISSLLLMHVFVMDLAWDAASYMYEFIVKIQERSTFPSAHWSDGIGLKALSNLFFGSSVVVSSLWLSGLRATASSTLGLALVIVDGMKEKCKDMYKKATICIRAESVKVIDNVENKTGLNLISQEERLGIDDLMRLYSSTDVDRYEAGALAKMLGKLYAISIIPSRVFFQLCSSVNLLVKKTFSKIREMIILFRNNIKGKLSDLKRRMELAREKALELKEEKMKGMETMSESMTGKQEETPVVSGEADKQNIDPARSQADPKSRGKSKERQTKQKKKDEKRFEAGESSIVKCGIKLGVSSYFGEKLARLGFEAALKTIKNRMDAKPDSALNQIPDDAEICSVEGAQPLDVDFLSYYYMNKYVKDLETGASNQNSDCDGLAGATIIGDACIVHKKFKSKYLPQGGGKLTMYNFGDINCFFLYNQMLQTNESQIIRYDLHNSSSIFTASYSAKEFLSSSCDSKQATIIGRVSLLIDNKEEVEYIVTASHMVPYGRICREFESYDSIDVLCSNWVFNDTSSRAEETGRNDVKRMEETGRNKAKLSPIISEFFIGDNTSDYLMFICKNGDYRGHSGGLILDRKNRPIAICVMQLRINNSLSLDSDKSIVIGCKLNRLDAKVFGVSSKRIMLCTNCCAVEVEKNETGSSINVTVEMGKLIFSDCPRPSTEIFQCNSLEGEFVKTGILEELCELNKNREIGVFLEKHSRSNTLIRLLEIIYHENTKEFDEPSAWLVKTVFDSVVESKVLLLIICSNMLSLSVCTLLTCVGVQFKRVRNLFSIEALCRDNVSERINDLVVISMDDLLIDLVKIKTMHRNYFRDRCKIFILCRTSAKDNSVDKLIVRMSILLGSRVKVKAWPIELALNVQSTKKMLNAPSLRYSQNSGHYRIVEMWTKYEKESKNEEEVALAGRVVVLTSASTQSSQEAIVSKLAAEVKLIKSNISIVNFASLSSEAVCESLLAAESLCLTSWTSGDLTAGVYYNMQMDTVSDNLELMMVEQSINFKLDSLKKGNKRLYLNEVIRSEYNYVSSLSDVIIEVKMAKTAKPKQVFLEELNSILENCTFRQKEIYRQWSDKTTDNMSQFEIIKKQTTYEVDQKSIVTEDFLRFAQERQRDIKERILDRLELVYIKMEKIKLRWILAVRKKILNLKMRLDRLISAIKNKIKRIKKKLVVFDIIKCHGALVTEILSESDEFDSCIEELSSDSDGAVDINKKPDAFIKKIFVMSKDGVVHSEVEKTESEFKTDLRDRRERIAQKIKNKAIELGIAFKNRTISLIKWLINLPVKTCKTVFNVLSTTCSYIVRKIGFGKARPDDKESTDKCSFSYEEKEEPSLTKRLIKSSLTALASSRLFNEKGVDAGSKMIASFCLDNLLYEVLGSLNKTAQNLYWRTTAVPSIVVAAIECYCYFTSSKIVIKVADLSLQLDGDNIKETITVIKNVSTVLYNSIRANASVNINCIVPTGLIIRDFNTTSTRNVFSTILELSFKLLELTKRSLFKIGLNGVVIKLWKIITGRTFENRQPSGVLTTVPCYIRTEEINFFGGLTLLVVGIVRLSMIKTEEKLAMIGVIAEKRHLADNINLYLKDRSEYATMIRIVCCSAVPLYWSKTSRAGRVALGTNLTLVAVDWFFSSSTYGGLSLSLAHVISRTLSASSWAGAFPSALAAWWEDGSSQKIAMNSLVLLGDNSKEKTKNKDYNIKKTKIFETVFFGNVESLTTHLLEEQSKEREGNAALIDQLLSPADALAKSMLIIRKKKLSARFMFKLMDEDKTNIRDQELFLNIDAVLSNRNTSEQYDSIIKIKDLYRNQCRYLGRLKELPIRKEDSLEAKSKQTSVLMVANFLWQNVIDEKLMQSWEAAGDSRSHVLIAISERNDSPINLNVTRSKVQSFCEEMNEIIRHMKYKLYDLVIFLNIDLINWLNVISISNEKSTPGILTRNRTNSRLTASYLPFYRHRVEAMREIILNKDVDEENEIINVFAKRRIEKKKKSNIIGKDVVITRTIQANECDYKTAICDVFNVIDKLVKITRGYTGVSVGMNFFVEFSNDDEINKVLANDLAKQTNMVTKRISLDHSSFDSSQRNWSIEAVKEFRKKIVDVFFNKDKKNRIKSFLDSCYDSLKCRVMLTAQGDLFGITGQQMSGHATTSVDNSIKSKCYCVAMISELEKRTGWRVLQETIRVQGDDTKMEALCSSKRRHEGEMVKTVINQEMKNLGQEVKISKIEIFEGDEASNFLSHYTYDSYIIIVNEEGLKRVVAKLPGRNYFDNINSLATTLKAGKTKKHRKELGLLAAKSASFLTMYIGDAYLSCACCLILAYCLNEMKMIRRSTNTLTVSKDKLAYLISSSDDIETVSVSFDHIFKLHGFDPTGKNYKVKSWIIGIFESEKKKATNVANLSKNILGLIGGRFEPTFKNQIKSIRDLMQNVSEGKLEELNVEELTGLISFGKEPIKLQIINTTVAYEPYLKLKQEVRREAGSAIENGKKKSFIVKSKKIKQEDMIKIIENWLGENGFRSKFKDNLNYINESGFLVNSQNSSGLVFENDKHLVTVLDRDVEALALGASISNSINIIIVEDRISTMLRIELGIKLVRGKIMDLNELSGSSFSAGRQDDKTKLKTIIESVRTVNDRRKLIISTFKTDFKKEFINCFYRL